MIFKINIQNFVLEVWVSIFKQLSISDSELDAAQIEEYFKLMDIYNENERTIEGNQRKIDLQEK